MRRVQDIAWPVIGLGAVAVSSWLLFKELRGLSYASLRDAFGSISPARWVMACAVDRARLFGARLVRPDRAPPPRAEDRLAVRRADLVRHLRHRAQSSALRCSPGARHPLPRLFDPRPEHRRGRTAGRLLLVHLRPRRGDARRRPAARSGPTSSSASKARPDWVGQAAGVVLIAAPCLYMLGSLLHFPSIRVGGFELTYPRPPIAARQLLAGPLELIGAAGIVFFAPADRQSRLRRGARAFSSPPSASRWSATRRAGSACSRSPS